MVQHYSRLTIHSLRRAPLQASGERSRHRLQASDKRRQARPSRNSRSNRYYGYGRRCSGTTGTIVGGVAGALLGRTVTRDGYHSGTTGTILGGALGALAGRAIDRDSCRR